MGAVREEWTDCLAVCGDRTRGNGFRLKEGTFRSDLSDEALTQVSQIGGGCFDPGDTQLQAGWGFEQHDVAVGVPVHCRG